MGENVQAALREAEKVVKKQKTCASKTSDTLASLISELTAARRQVAADSGPDGGAGALAALAARVAALDVTATLADHTKDLHSSVTRLGKALDKAFVPDICKATRDLEFDPATLNQVVAEHLFQTGQFEVGEAFLAEAAVPAGQGLKKPFAAMHHVLQQMQVHNLGPALDWVAAHRAQLAAAGPQAAGFEFKLHRLQFLHILSKQGQSEALAYARRHFEPFRCSQLHDIQRLMACLVFARRGGGASPYCDLLAPGLWQDAQREFARQCCGLLGQAYESPLLMAVAAGSVALPTLLKLAAVMEAQSQELASCAQLPVELELGREFVFHSIFACPVSREQSTPENPPMMLPCGHVLCKQSVLKIARSPTRTFKCPYCPAEATPGICREIFFPEVQF